MASSRIGLSIDNSSESCESDLSDSENSSIYPWNRRNYSTEQQLIPTHEISLSFDAEPAPMTTTKLDSCISLPLLSGRLDEEATFSFRSRVHRRLEVLQKDYDEESSHDDPTFIQSRQRRGSLRSLLAFFVLGILMVSLNRNERRYSVSAVPREEVAFPLHQRKPEQPLKDVSHLPKYYLPKVEVQPQQKSPAVAQTAKLRSNVAMARSRESRPVFGDSEAQQHRRHVERFVLKDQEPPKAYHPPASPESTPLSYSWTTWIASFALVGMLVETALKEFRLCNIDETLEAQRRR